MYNTGELKPGPMSKIVCSKEYKRWKEASAKLQQEITRRRELDQVLMMLNGDISKKKEVIAAAEAAQTAEERAEAIDIAIMSGGGLFDCKQSSAAATQMQTAADAEKKYNDETDRKIKLARSELASLDSTLSFLRTGKKGILKSGTGKSDNNVAFAEYTDDNEMEERLENRYAIRMAPFKTDVDDSRNKKVSKARLAARKAADYKNMHASKEIMRDEIIQNPADYIDGGVPADVIEEESALIPAVPAPTYNRLYYVMYRALDGYPLYMAIPDTYDGNDRLGPARAGTPLEAFDERVITKYDIDVSDTLAGGAKKRSAKKPAAKKPATKKPATKKPASKKPAAKKPAAKKPAAKKPSAKKPVAKKPAAKKPAAKK